MSVQGLERAIRVLALDWLAHRRIPFLLFSALTHAYAPFILHISYSMRLIGYSGANVNRI